MSTSESFNPYGLHAIRIPLGMVPFAGLSWGAKVLYGRLALHLGKPSPKEHCNPDILTLGAEMGVSSDTIHRFLQELIEQKFVERRRHGKFRAECIFLPHPCFANSATLRNREAVTIPQPCGHNTANSRKDSPQPAETKASCASENVQENVNENIQSSSGIPAVQQHDDEPPLSEKTEPGKPEDLDALVSVARDQLRAARAAGAKVPQEQIGSPDRGITEQILAAFSDYTDFTTWLESTVSRGVARKATSARWGLFLSDAKNQAEDLRLKRESEEKREQGSRIERERRQAVEAEQQRVMDIPVAIAEAIQAIDAHRIAEQTARNPGRLMFPPDAFRPSSVLRARCERTGEPISPNELERQARAWHKCVACSDSGTTGTAIDSDLRFCGCAAGIEAQYRDGADWPAREIERAHAGAKGLLVAACRALNLQFAGDALQDADLVDDGETLEITLATATDAIGISGADVKEALGRVGWQRAVRIIGLGSLKATDEPWQPVNGTLQPITQADVEALVAQRGATQ